MTTVSVDEMLIEHVPYRMQQLDALCWACGLIIKGQRSNSLLLLLDQVPHLYHPSCKHLTNGLAEAGLVHCRTLLNFLGIALDSATGQLKEIQKPGAGDNFSIVKLSRPPVTLQDLRAAPTASPTDVVEACTRTLLASAKGVAHFTDQQGSRSQAQDALLCARTVLWLVEEHVYRRRGTVVPYYNVWTAAQQPHQPDGGRTGIEVK